MPKAVGASCGINLGRSNGSHQNAYYPNKREQAAKIGYQASVNFSMAPVKHLILQTGLSIQSTSSATVFPDMRFGDLVTPNGFVKDESNGDYFQNFVYQMVGIPFKIGYSTALFPEAQHRFYVFTGTSVNWLTCGMLYTGFTEDAGNKYERSEVLSLSEFNQTLFSLSGTIGYEYRRNVVGINLSLGAEYFLTSINKSSSSAPAEHLYNGSFSLGLSYWMK